MESEDKWPRPEKYMTLSEACENANDGDTLIFNNRNQYEYHEGVNFAIGCKAAISRKWKIIPAEPKVLTGEQWHDKNYSPDSAMADEYNQEHMIHAFYEGDQNGQLKQWLNHKELRKLAESWISSYQNALPKQGLVREFAEALENLKPLEKNE